MKTRTTNGPDAAGTGLPQPQRCSLVAQTVAILRARLRAGGWERLPPERELCRRLRIARNTLRKALAALEAQGLIARVRHGRGRTPTPRPGAATAARRASIERVVFFTEQSLLRVQPTTLLQIDLLRQHLSAAGLTLDVRTGRAFDVGRPSGMLEAMLQGETPSLWTLHHAPRPLQEWFAQQGLPAVVLGYPHADVRLPYVTEDVRAAAVHAVGRLVALGHRRIALLRSRTALAGHAVAAAGMAAAAERHGVSVADIRTVALGDTAEEIAAAVDALLAGTRPPTAVIATSIPVLVTLMTHLGRRRIPVPDALSVVSLFDDPVLAHIVPPIARYRVNPEVLVRRLVDKLLAVRDAGTAAVRPSRIMCEWLPGATLGAAPPATR